MIVRSHARKVGEVPPIVPIVLTQACKFHGAGAIDRNTYEAQLARLQREELAPRGLALITRELAGGRTRFLIEACATGDLWATIECRPALRRRTVCTTKRRGLARRSRVLATR